jgi:hypothetical protein
MDSVCLVTSEEPSGETRKLREICCGARCASGERGIEKTEWRGRIDLGQGQNAFALRRVLIERHRFGRGVNDLDASLAS